MIKGFDRIGGDAINVGKYELTGGLDHLIQIASQTSIPFISANLLDPDLKEPIFKPYILINSGGIKFGVIGLTDLVSDNNEQLIVDDYILAGNIYLDVLQGKVDIMVLLVNCDRSSYGDLHKLFPSADLIFTSGSTLLTRPMMNQEENGPFIFSSGREGRYLNQFDIFINDKSKRLVNKSYYNSKVRYLKKRIERYAEKNPNLSIENIYGDQPEVLEIIKNTRSEIRRMEKILEQNNNSISFKNVAMSSKIKDNFEMFEYVKKAIALSNKLIIRN